MKHNSFLAETDFLEVIKEFSEAERLLKKNEHLALEVSLPAINQLRYAGKHITRVLTETTQDRLSQLQQAAGHCQRASYDACEAGLLFLLLRFSSFQEDYKNVSILSVYKDYASDRAKYEAAKKLIDNVEDSNKNALAKEIEKHLDMLVEIDMKLPILREELNKVIRDQRMSDYKYILSILFTLLAIAVSIAIACYK